MTNKPTLGPKEAAIRQMKERNTEAARRAAQNQKLLKSKVKATGQVVRIKMSKGTRGR